MTQERLAFRPDLQATVWTHHRRTALQPGHRHEELEFNLVQGGRLTYLVGGDRIDLGPHGLVWLFPGQEHHLLATTADLSMYVVVFRPALVRRLARSLGDPALAASDPGQVRHCVLSAAVAGRLVSLIAEMREAEPVRGLFNAVAGHLLAFAWNSHLGPGGSGGRTVHPTVLRALELLQRNPAIAGAALARAVGMSRAGLSRLFAQEAGTTLCAFRTKLRVERFLTLARAGSSLAAAAFDAGFGSYSQCHAMVKAHLGMPPRAAIGRPGR